MAFPETQIANWVQHHAQEGLCMRCGLPIRADVSGAVYLKPNDTDVLLCEPRTNWTVCP